MYSFQGIVCGDGKSRMSDHARLNGHRMDGSEIFPEEQVAVVTGEADVGVAFSKLPFDHLLFFAAWPMWAACIALFVLREHDQYTVGGSG